MRPDSLMFVVISTLFFGSLLIGTIREIRKHLKTAETYEYMFGATFLLLTAWGLHSIITS